MRPFREILNDGVVVFDGGMGTMLYDKGVFINRCFDELNLSEPALVKSVHADYLRAGADVIETNTFGANAVKLEGHGCGDRLAEINRRGAELAREVAQDRALVAGSIGPLGIKIEPWGPTSTDEARDLFHAQALALREGGVDLFVLETFSDINEIRQAIRAVRDLDPEIPIVAQMTLGDDGNSLYGTSPEVFTQRLESWGADVIGVNCSVGPAIMLDAVERMARVAKKPISVQPNAGLPRNVDGRNIYLASPEYVASYAKRFVASGARCIGGCCGTTPDHIRAIHKAVKGSAPHTARVFPGAAPVTAEAAPVTPVERAQKSRLARFLSERSFVVVAEVSPPRGFDATATLAEVRLLRDAGVDLFDVPEGARASARMSSEALALLLERDAAVETLVHYLCRDRALLGVQSDLLGSFALGLRNVVCETGDAPGVDDEAGATADYELDSIGLTNVVHRLNQGYDVGSSPLGMPTGWHIGVIANPTAVNLEDEVRRFEWKVDAGAEFAVLKPLFDLDALTNFLKRIEHCRVPVLTTVTALASLDETAFLSNEVPGMRVPAAVLDRMRDAQATSPERAAEEGIAIASELIAGARRLVEGVVVVVAPGRAAAAARLAAAARG